MNQLKQQENDHITQPSPCSPSFNAYTTNTHIADIASRVVALDINGRYDNTTDEEEDDYEDDDFEFGFSCTTIPESMPVYPVFNRDLLRDLGSSSPAKVELRNLFFEEDNGHHQDIRLSTTSELEADEYCLWAPKSPSPSPTRCGSTGSGPPPVVTKTWRLRNLLRRCKSDGKEGLMLMSSSTSSNSNSNTTSTKKGKEKAGKNKSLRLPSSSPSLSPPWSGGGGKKEVGGKRVKSYLPYKQELLGFFGSPQTLRKINIPPF